MIKIFGTKTCAACRQKIKELKKAKIEFRYYDLETSEGLAEAAYQGLLDGRPLPIVVIRAEDKK